MKRLEQPITTVLNWTFMQKGNGGMSSSPLQFVRSGALNIASLMWQSVLYCAGATSTQGLVTPPMIRYTNRQGSEVVAMNTPGGWCNPHVSILWTAPRAPAQTSAQGVPQCFPHPQVALRRICPSGERSCRSRFKETRFSMILYCA